jgi:tRNA/tmRNA/rRNA uracil-C5-methylase (TrmA/RlmC/RlmD family)
MHNSVDVLKSGLTKIAAKCPAFGICCGCAFQDINYQDELRLKETYLRSVFKEHGLEFPAETFDPIVASPQEYHYRNRIDLKLKKVLRGDIFIGFTPLDRRGVEPVEACFIARKEISDAIPAIKQEAVAMLPEKYRLANLTVRSGDDKRVHWGGIGRGSLSLQKKDFLWTEINGKRIHYSLDTFFQANLSILPPLIEKIAALPLWQNKPLFLDLYGGVGLFTFALSGKFGTGILIEECGPSLDIARYNAEFHNLPNILIKAGKVESYLQPENNLFGGIDPAQNIIAMIDPPRAGLSAKARNFFSRSEDLPNLLYLSCNPKTLAVDLRSFLENGWKVLKIIPFDFFPRTAHLETLIWLTHN